MVNRKSVAVSLSQEVVVFADQMILSGRYGNVSEVARAAIRQLQERELKFQACRNLRQASSLTQGNDSLTKVRGRRSARA